MVHWAENPPPSTVKSTAHDEWPIQTTQKYKTKRKPKEIIPWNQSCQVPLLPTKAPSCLDDNLLNIYHVTLSGAGTKTFCHSDKSKIAIRQERLSTHDPQIRKAFYHGIQQTSRVFTSVCYLEDNYL